MRNSLLHIETPHHLDEVITTNPAHSKTSAPIKSVVFIAPPGVEITPPGSMERSELS